MNGEQLTYVDVDVDDLDLDLEEDVPDMPAELRAAFDAAGVFEIEGAEPGEADYTIGMRVVWAM